MAMAAPLLSDLVEPGVPEKMAAGFQFTEGPLWMPDGYLIFSDIPANKIYKLVPGGKAEVFKEIDSGPNGLVLDAKGRVVICEQMGREVSRIEPDGKVVTIAERFKGRRLNSPNDAALRSDGSIYFTDPPYGVQPKDRELGFQGVYRLLPNGELTLLIKDLDRPNGIAFSPDEKRLYVADSSDLKFIKVFDVKADGSLANGRLFAELKSNEPGVPDGLKIDKNGNVFSTGPGGIWIFSPDGTHIGTVETPEVPANCAWGDSDYKSLYITARTSVYRIRCKTGGKVPKK